MKKLLIILLLFMASCSAISYCVFYRGEVRKSNRELEKVAEKGKIIIDALEKFRKDNGDYPLKLSSLYPQYINNDVNLVYDFKYLRGDQARGGIFTNEEINEWGGYELGISNIKQWVFSPFGRSWYVFVYNPSKLYPERKWIKPVKRVKDWALLITLRRYGSKENPIVGPGV
jgi:hypothetical protein